MPGDAVDSLAKPPTRIAEFEVIRGAAKHALETAVMQVEPLKEEGGKNMGLFDSVTEKCARCSGTLGEDTCGR